MTAPSNIVIQDNEFGPLYYPKGGQYGPAAHANPRQAGNVWSGNVWSGNVWSGTRLPGKVLRAGVSSRLPCRPASPGQARGRAAPRPRR